MLNTVANKGTRDIRDLNGWHLGVDVLVVGTGSLLFWRVDPFDMGVDLVCSRRMPQIGLVYGFLWS